MIKKSLNLIVCLLIFQTARAASTDSLTFYLKNSGREVQKDSADFYRVILPPDTNVDKELYQVFEFYPNGKPKLVALSLTQPHSLAFHGTCIEYFPNGKQKEFRPIKKGCSLIQ